MTTKYRHICFSMLFLLKNNVFAETLYGYDEQEFNNQELQASLPEDNIKLLSSPLLGDTAGPSFTLAIGTAATRIIDQIDMRNLGNNNGYYASADCSGGFINEGGLAAGTSFTFTDNAPIYFGRTALSALSNNDTNTRCIQLSVAQGSSSYVFLQIQNLTCNGTVCSGGNICYLNSPSPSQWSVSSTPAC